MNRNCEFEGQVALITGGGTGLGLEVSSQLGRAGARVVCLSRSTEHHQELLRRGASEGFEVLSEALDVCDAKAVRQVVRALAEKLGRIDILVNNAAGNFIRPSLSLAPKAFAKVIDIALNGVFYMSREVGRTMHRQGRGAIVNISAPYAATGKAGVVHSACAKAGVEAMTKTLAAEWAAAGIRVNAVSPGPFVSDGAGDRLWPNQELEDSVRRSLPLGRFGKASEIAELVCLLASERASFITGSILLADGGMNLPGPFAEGKIDRRRP